MTTTLGPTMASTIGLGNDGQSAWLICSGGLRNGQPYGGPDRRMALPQLARYQAANDEAGARAYVRGQVVLFKFLTGAEAISSTLRELIQD